MAVVVIKPSEFEAWIKKQLIEDSDLVRKAALEAVQFGVREAVRITNEVGAVDQGLFKLSWTSSIGIKDRAAELRNDAPYAGIIERGRRPGRPGPPLLPILGWVKRKFGGEIKGQYRFAKRMALGMADGKGTRKGRADARRQVREAFDTQAVGVGTRVLYVAMHVREAIHVKGIKPRWILRRTKDAMLPVFKAEALRRLRSNRR